jgi:hypothetical protein
MHGSWKPGGVRIMAGVLVVVAPSIADASERRSSGPERRASAIEQHVDDRETSTYQRGFYLRLASGVGPGTIGNPELFASGSILGASHSLQLAAGVVVLPKFALHASVRRWTLRIPVDAGSDDDYDRYDYDDYERPNSDVSSHVLGVGMTRYFTEGGFMTMSIGRNWLSSDSRGFASESGVAVDWALGTEWRLSEAWGVGVAGELFYGWLDPSSTLAISVLLTVSVN